MVCQLAIKYLTNDIETNILHPVYTKNFIVFSFTAMLSHMEVKLN